MNKKVNLENFDIKTKFSIPEQRENLTSGESISNSFGKIEKVIEDLKGQLVKLDVKKTKIEEDINGIYNKMWEEYELTPNNVGEYQKPENVQLTQRRVNSLRTEIKELGSVNVDAIDEYKNLRESLISNATTQGIKKNRCMKSSGVEWVLEIPSDWDMIPAKTYR